MILGRQKTPLSHQLASVDFLTIQAVIYKLSQPFVYIFRQILISFDRFKKKKRSMETLNNDQSNKDSQN